ncbi:MFS transporter [Nonomuraea africana]|uniref:EmrB/QacA subfamily drug resistance transporter n=1 Tax=Nonomuraea africana TaxID=46171 RepID=A0ABR9KEK7_9ACTN|nr:MFS transporter [Nonomuraea africana]MBE1560469.1 EmrB/QacA subfamily drug resistance transporter [Nonomuraea africana]
MTSTQSTSRGPGILLAVLCLAQFMLILDVAVVAVALPTIQPDLGISPADIQWVGTAYALAFGGFLVTAGRMADLFGARKLMVLGLIVFAVASLGCGLAETGWMLFASRGLQGLGAALVSPAALSIVTTSFGEGEGRAKAMGVWGAVSAGGAVAGQLLGGVLIGLAGWEWIFFVNLPIAALVLLAVLFGVSATPGRASGRTDVVGAALLTGAFVLLVTGASQAAKQGLSAPVALLGLAAVVLLGAFWVTERRVQDPIVPLGLFRNRHVTLGNVICFASSATVMATVFLAAMVMQQVLGASALQAGLSFAPVSAVITVVALKSGAAVARFGVRNVLLASALLIAAGSLLLATVPAEGSFLLHVVPGLLVSGIGGGLGFAPGMLVATTGVADHQQGLASGLLSTSQQLGGVFGLAALNLVAVQAASAAVGSADAAVAGYRAGFLAALVFPAVVAVCSLALPRQQAPAAMSAGGSSTAPDPVG